MYDIVDRSEIDRLVSILHKGRFGADVANQAANLISELTEDNFNLRLALRADAQTLRLHLGEMSAQEMRTLKAGFAWVLTRAALNGRPEHTDVKREFSTFANSENAAPPAPTDDPECTCCRGTGITLQTERRCSCQAAQREPKEG